MWPAIIHEQLVQFFKFYFDGNICEGMSHRGRLFRLVESFPLQQRAQAYVVGCKYAAKGGETVITVSSEHYRVWVDLQHSAVRKESAPPVRKVGSRSERGSSPFINRLGKDLKAGAFHAAPVFEASNP